MERRQERGYTKQVLHDSGVKIRQVYDIEHGYYREIMQYRFPFVEDMVTAFKTGDYSQAFQTLEENHSQEAELCCKFLLKYVLYSLTAAQEVGYNIHSADDVMATGFNWCPPLAVIEALGGRRNLYIYVRID